MIQGEVNRVVLATDGSTTGFSFPTTFLKSADLKVWLQNATTGLMVGQLSESTHYVLEGVLDSVGRYVNGATVRTTIVYPSGYNIIIYQDPEVSQLVDLRDNGLLPVESQIELPLDKLTAIAQRLKRLILRSLRQPEHDSADVTELPDKVTRASKFLGFDSNGNPIAAAGTSANLAPVSAFANTLLDDADAPTARITLGFPDLDTKGELAVGTGVGGVLGSVPNNGVAGMVLAIQPALSTGLAFGQRDQFNGLINGDCDIWQNGYSFPNMANGAYCADMWRHNKVGSGFIDVTRDTDVPSFITKSITYTHSLKIAVSTADAAIAAGDHYVLSTFLEGYDWRYWAQKDFHIEFMVKSSKTGVYGLYAANSISDRTAFTTFTINSANTWELKQCLIPASVSTGTWDYTTGLGLMVGIVLAAGGDFHNTAGSWLTGNFLTSSSQVNFMDNTSNTMRIVGMRMAPGFVSFPARFEPFSLRLHRAKRYFQKSRVYGEAITDASGNGKGEQRDKSAVTGAAATWMDVRFPVSMRQTPAISTWNPNGGNTNVRNISDAADCSGVGSAAVTSESAQITFTANAGAVPGDQFGVHWAADARF